MKKILNVGLVGLGGISASHLQALSQLACVRVVALCDVDLDRARAAAVRFGLSEALFFKDYSEMLASVDMDVLHIMTPHYRHADMAIPALKAGKFVLLEKPMDISLQKIKELIRADELGRLGISYQNRYNAATRAAKGIIESGEYGKLMGLRATVAWYRDRSYYDSGEWRGKWATEGGGVLINQSIHTMDLLYYLGGAFEKIKGSATLDVLRDVIEVEDNAHAVIRYRDGKTGLFYASTSYVKDDPVEIHLTFEKGTLRIMGDNLYCMDGEIVCLSKNNGEKGVGKAVYGTGHDALVRDFYECALENRPFPISGSEAYPSIWAALSIYESGKRNAWIEAVDI